MSEELKREKEDIDYRIGILKAKIDRARRDAARAGLFLPPDELQAKETKLVGLKRRSQEIQRLLGNEKDKDGLPVHFMNVAQELLSPQEFDRLLQVALNRKKARNGTSN